MTRKNSYQSILATSILLTFLSCNQAGKKSDKAETSDSAVNAKTETAPPAAENKSIDAVKTAPNLYHVANDTLGIRVLEATYKPGDSSAMHSHPDNAIYVIAGGTTEFTGQDGKKMVTELKTGMISVRPEEFHSVKNIGKTTAKVLLVEVNRPRGTTTPGATTDATKAAPALYKLNSDTLGIRVLEVTYKPGQSSALHAHPDNAVYVINGGSVEFTEKDGTKHAAEFKPGMTMIAPGGEHSVKNTGKTTLKVLLVEVNRPRK